MTTILEEIIEITDSIYKVIKTGGGIEDDLLEDQTDPQAGR